MAFKLSTGLQNALATALDTNMANGYLQIYSGAQPADPDDEPSGTLLVTLTDDGGAFTPGTATNGLNLDSASVSDGQIPIDSTETWQGTAVATGIAGCFVFRENADLKEDGSTTRKRISGTVGTSGADLNLTSTTITTGETIGITSGSFTVPS